MKIRAAVVLLVLVLGACGGIEKGEGPVVPKDPSPVTAETAPTTTTAAPAAPVVGAVVEAEGQLGDEWHIALRAAEIGGQWAGCFGIEVESTFLGVDDDGRSPWWDLSVKYVLDSSVVVDSGAEIYEACRVNAPLIFAPDLLTGGATTWQDSLLVPEGTRVVEVWIEYRAEDILKVPIP